MLTLFISVPRQLLEIPHMASVFMDIGSLFLTGLYECRVFCVVSLLLMFVDSLEQVWQQLCGSRLHEQTQLCEEPMQVRSSRGGQAGTEESVSFGTRVRLVAASSMSFYLLVPLFFFLPLLDLLTPADLSIALLRQMSKLWWPMGGGKAKEIVD